MRQSACFKVAYARLGLEAGYIIFVGIFPIAMILKNIILI